MGYFISMEQDSEMQILFGKLDDYFVHSPNAKGVSLLEGELTDIESLLYTLKGEGVIGLFNTSIVEVDGLEDVIYGFDINRERFEKFKKRTKENIKKFNSKSGIYYNSITGKGWFKDKDFTFKDHQPEFRLFKELYGHIGETIKRFDVLIIMGKTEGTKNSQTNEINELVKKIRARTQLNTKELVQNNGNITLVGQKLGDFPN